MKCYIVLFRESKRVRKMGQIAYIDEIDRNH